MEKAGGGLDDPVSATPAGWKKDRMPKSSRKHFWVGQSWDICDLVVVDPSGKVEE